MADQRILIADDHPLVREGLVMAIRARHPAIVTDCVESVAAAESMARQHRGYRLMLLDYRLPDADGFSGLFRMQHALGAVPIALISAHDEPYIVNAARAVGAAGFLSKSQPLDLLVQSIDGLLNGASIFPASIGIDSDMAALQARLKSLSGAQMRVLAALAKGHLNKQIAGDLGLSEATVKAHLTAIFRKLKVTNRVQALIAVRPLFDPTD
ncbi:response regulator transcription factor [soil metagenome]